jgi:hypothetical protein
VAYDRDTDHLHPLFRKKHKAIMKKLEGEQIPFRLFEGYRTPARQAHLYAQGRTRSGPIVTRAQPWKSIHQYGLAGDYVLFIDNKWSWDTSGQRGLWWNRLHELAREVGLEPLSFEKPHLQVAGLSLGDLRGGRYPDGGDESWADNLAEQIFNWNGSPPAPPVPSLVPERPALDADTTDTEPVAPAVIGRRMRVIARRGLRLREGPGTHFEVVGSLAHGAEVWVLIENGDWCQVDEEGDGAADGFAHRDYLVAVG